MKRRESQSGRVASSSQQSVRGQRAERGQSQPMATEGVLASSWLTMEDRLPTLTQSWAVQWGPLWNVRKLYRKSGHVATNKDSDDCTKNKQHHPIEIWWATCVICEGWSLRVKLTAASFSVIFQVQLHLQAFLQQIYFKSNTSFVTLWQEFACGFLFSFLISRWN